ncbi:fungal-specific transcription factor domain-containing protein [Ilyonectria robusta]|uniref:fungal-specific transcription factor domain-containing protein n=1 Tax=Ilyonectria robusta TaxID=1079257 RepID=UPI001E8DC156|nr:fungal-specific transcription factor domain-containing protein [Ilyonectria robusta]KAH8656884.1 fungal-specific transcription factor domain-containing protein [Ilyonectria robusta]
MVFALSAVTRYRKGESKEHPYGYYLAAQTHIGGFPLIGTLDTIQNLLLVTRFGMYHHVGTSLWEISRFCMRQCIEQSLHARPIRPLGLLEEQHQRRVFWECYILDRYSSGVLGRPFAIADKDITIELPIDAADGTITQSTGANSLASIDIRTGSHPTELSVFIFHIKLRKVTSRIHSEFYARRSIPSSSGAATPIPHRSSSGHIYVKLYQFLNELDLWRQDAPVFDSPQSLYERVEWYDFLLEKEKLLLIRGAIHIAPRRNGQPPDDLLVMCLDSATQIIELYNRMMQIKCITWTRNYFQVIFTAGLSIIYCVSVGVHNERSRTGYMHQPVITLALCSNILRGFRQEMPDAGRFAIVFEILKDNLLKDTNIISTLNTDQPDGGTVSHQHVSQGHELYEINLQNRLPDSNHLAAALVEMDHSRQNMMDTLAPPQTQTEIRSPLSQIPDDNGALSNFGYINMDLHQDEIMDWPTLTDEMMEQLEAGLGEYAWGSMDTDFHTWDF